MRGKALRYLVLDFAEIAALCAKQFGDIQAAVAVEFGTRNENVVLEIGVIHAHSLDEGRPNRIQVRRTVSGEFLACYGADNPGFVRFAVGVDLIRHCNGPNILYSPPTAAHPRHESMGAMIQLS